MKWIYKVEAFLLDIFFPNKCPVCDKDIGYDELICRECEKELEFVGDNYCPRCGKTECICQKEEIYYDRCFSFIYYKDAGKNGVLALKERHGTGFAEYFAIKAVEYLKENELSNKIDVITSVPVTKRKMRETGYNHAHIYAKMIHRHSGIPVNGKLLIKTDKTLVQHELSAAERKQRASKAFRFIGDECLVRGKTVLLCDDIITTGSTLNYCAKVLKQAGAENVICCTIAMTQLGDGKDIKKNADVLAYK